MASIQPIFGLFLIYTGICRPFRLAAVELWGLVGICDWLLQPINTLEGLNLLAKVIRLAPTPTLLGTVHRWPTSPAVAVTLQCN